MSAEIPTTAPPRALTNRLVWHGWQLDLPDDWNPARLSGDHHRGLLIAADLERVRLELHWQRVRSPRRVDLTRVARARHPADAAWTHTARHPGFDRAVFARPGPAESLALLLSPSSSRLLFVRIETDPPGHADAILASLRDVASSDPTPWAIYGFHFTVPLGHTLADHAFFTGRAALTFRRRRCVLTFERHALAVPTPPDDAHDDTPAADPTFEHLGHPVHIQPSTPASPWHRFLRRDATTASWTCPASSRRFRVLAAGPHSRTSITPAVLGVRCHPPE